MLNRVGSTIIEPVDTTARSAETTESSLLVNTVALLRRQWQIVAAILVAVLGIGVLYLALAQPVYKATSNVLLDTRKLQLSLYAGSGQSPLGETTIDLAAVDSQLEISRQ